MQKKLSMVSPAALSPLSVFMHDLQRQHNSEMIHIEFDNAKTPSVPHLRHRPHSMSNMDEAKRRMRKERGTRKGSGTSKELRRNSMPVFGTIEKSASVSRWEVGCYSPTVEMKDKVTNEKWDSRVEKPRRRLSGEKINFSSADMASTYSSFKEGRNSFSSQEDSASVRQLPDYQAALAALRLRDSPSSSIDDICPPVDGSSAPKGKSRKVLREPPEDHLTLPIRRESIHDDDDDDDFHYRHLSVKALGRKQRELYSGI